MTSRLLPRIALGLGALGVIALAIDPAFAQDAANAVKDAAAAAPDAAKDAATAVKDAAAAATPAAAPAAAAAPVPNKGDTAFMISSSVLVLLMTVPGLALFYGGLVRSKNMLSVLMQILATLCITAIIWYLYGYSMTFTNGGSLNNWVGGFSKVLLSGVDANSVAATFSNGVVIPEYVYIVFQMTFACITPCLIVGAFAERVKFSALMLFMILWVTLIYFPIAHMVWYWAGPDAIAAAAKKGKDALDAVNLDAGQAFQWGAIDFAGGTVVHINAGIAGLMGCLVMGKRVGYGREAMPPHSLTMSFIGTGLLWVGWFGFNVGSNLEANGVAGVAMINTFLATAAAGLAWMCWEWIVKGKPSLLGLMSGVVAGLVAITPACGFAGIGGSIILGIVAGIVCSIFATGVKNAFGYDDSLDVFGVHCIGGIIGALGTGILVNPAFGGQGILDYSAKPGEGVVAAYDMITQLTSQGKAVGMTLLWSGLGSLILYKLVDILVGLRPVEEKEREGLDITDHGERAYNY